jgi:hypothetical protein
VVWATRLLALILLAAVVIALLVAVRGVL